ncbi:hypothetical protein [Bacillus weihaiensis]|uniref:Uncharacterized protein n=1 Tax=Bacillus weihaiensis TaxID=1547283 RepID=A0A1L3MRH0_9BACI|nr:hypothetical protein [Bacillus weihaiensis]APH04926.1 hypothetical protein A9C19_09285 [Bacillus weihaiensis]
MVIKELYLRAIQQEESTLAHYLFHLLKEKKIRLEEPVSSLNFDLANHDEVADLIERNVLGFHKVCIYSLKRNKHQYVFIFARSEKSAIQHFITSFHQEPMSCHEHSLNLELVRGKGVISFREMKKEFDTFPAIAGYYQAEQRVYRHKQYC